MRFGLEDLVEFPSKIIGKTIDRLNDRYFDEVVARAQLNGLPPIYHVHIPKTGGTSLSQTFLSLGGEDGKDVWDRLALIPGHRIVSGDKVFVGWERRNIERGKYFFAFSHIPLQELRLPDGIFTITCFRDPVDRLMSYYRNLKQYHEEGERHPVLRDVKGYIDKGFGEFIGKLPRSRLHNQLFMFSRTFDRTEALERVSQLSHVMFTEEFEDGIRRLRATIDLPIEPFHMRRSKPADVSDDEMARLRELMAPEYEFLEQVRALRT